MTIDGKIALNSNHFAGWTSHEDKKYFARISREIGVIVMGDKTFNTFPGPLKDRLNVVFTLEENPKEQEWVKYVSGDPKKVLDELEEMGYKSVLLGGGAFINSMFLENNLIDEIIITIEPKIFGSGLSLFSKEQMVDLELISHELLSENVIALRYKVKK